MDFCLALLGSKYLAKRKRLFQEIEHRHNNKNILHRAAIECC